ncbi:MAG: hypothetical protein ACREEM_31270 [Blastocatellia bacterium]
MQINNCLVIIKQTAMAQGGRAASARKGDETAKRLLHADAEQKRTVYEVRLSIRWKRRIAMLCSPAGGNRYGDGD